ncbi:MAG: cation-translocating P-type ATPase, partial [Clostridia bacterium]|nr:cation-translocating P-type ATPase [Clostridia bacterium]
MENLSNRTNDGQNLKIIGLTAEEVLSRRQQGLTNKVKRKASKSYLKIFIDNFCTFFNLLCFACFFVLLSVAKDTAISNYFFVILFVANSVIGTIQEIRAKLTVERLSLMKAPTARVLRGGEFLSIPVEEVVLDDVIELSLGSQIPADCVVLEGFIDANESLLTGESVAVRKNVGDKLLSGSFV